MRVFALLVAFVLAIAPACHASPIHWPEPDKVAHFGAGYVISDQLYKRTGLTAWERLAVVGLIAYAKERLDSRLDKRDLVATVAGVGFLEIKF